MSSFATQLQAIVDKRKATLNQVARMITFEVGNRIIIRTPVDKGTLAGNWLWSVGSPDQSFSYGKTGQDESIGQLNAMMQTFDTSQVGYFTNSMPYASRIENEGWSQKAPSGMVAITLAEYPAIADRVIRSFA